MSKAGRGTDEGERIEIELGPSEETATGEARGFRTPVDDFAASIGSRNLMIIIVTMPLVFLMVVMGIIGLFGNDEEAVITGAAPGAVRSTPVEVLNEPMTSPSTLSPINASAPALINVPIVPGGIDLPDGARAGAISLDGDRLAVRAEGPDGVEIVIYDLTRGAVVQRVPITAAAETTAE